MNDQMIDVVNYNNLLDAQIMQMKYDIVTILKQLQVPTTSKLIKQLEYQCDSKELSDIVTVRLHSLKKQQELQIQQENKNNVTIKNLERQINLLIQKHNMQDKTQKKQNQHHISDLSTSSDILKISDLHNKPSSIKNEYIYQFSEQQIEEIRLLQQQKLVNQKQMKIEEENVQQLEIQKQELQNTQILNKKELDQMLLDISNCQQQITEQQNKINKFHFNNSNESILSNQNQSDANRNSVLSSTDSKVASKQQTKINDLQSKLQQVIADYNILFDRFQELQQQLHQAVREQQSEQQIIDSSLQNNVE